MRRIDHLPFDEHWVLNGVTDVLPGMEQIGHVGNRQTTTIMANPDRIMLVKFYFSLTQTNGRITVTDCSKNREVAYNYDYIKGGQLELLSRIKGRYGNCEVLHEPGIMD